MDEDEVMQNKKELRQLKEGICINNEMTPTETGNTWKTETNRRDRKKNKSGKVVKTRYQKYDSKETSINGKTNGIKEVTYIPKGKILMIT